MSARTFSYSGRELDALARNRNYYRWIHRHFEPFIGRRVLEVGAGVATFSDVVLRRSRPTRFTLVEPDRDHYEILGQRFATTDGVDVFEGFLEDAPASEPLDSIVAVNVIEHVRDDRALMSEIFDRVAPGGHVLIYTPSVPALFGTLDEAFGHWRRYTEPGLRSLGEDVGLETVELRSINLPGVLTWYLAGRVFRKTWIRPWEVVVYDRLVIPWVAALEGLVQPPIGQGLLYVGRRPEADNAS